MPGMSVSAVPPLTRRLHVGAQLADRASGVAIGAHAERVRALDVEQVGDLVEDCRDSGVYDWHAWLSPWVMFAAGHDIDLERD